MAMVTPIDSPPGERRRLRLASPATGATIEAISSRPPAPAADQF